MIMNYPWKRRIWKTIAKVVIMLSPLGRPLKTDDTPYYVSWAGVISLLYG
jgi:hypothetical protein